ncbi:putative exonuclease RNase T and DNA polymerase III [Escherichia coli]|uniref:Putative exonuclease RNase T and DNA polymerase III n=1 Tax=Escherichia coli TaxID=562 RepID=A0A484X611_ECOLX|nr:putative exonuclease RNase T and DNA polymerase III [Escherichia coli]
MRKQPDALRYDRQTIFGLVRERPIDIHKDPVALNKYICEYLTTKGVFENEETDLGTVDVLQSSETQTDAVETEVSDIPKNETAPEAEPSVEREGRSISSSQIRTEKNTVAQTNFLVWIRHWLLAPLKSQKKNILPEKMAHTRAYRKM